MINPPEEQLRYKEMTFTSTENWISTEGVIRDNLGLPYVTFREGNFHMNCEMTDMIGVSLSIPDPIGITYNEDTNGSNYLVRNMFKECTKYGLMKDNLSYNLWNHLVYGKYNPSIQGTATNSFSTIYCYIGEPYYITKKSEANNSNGRDRLTLYGIDRDPEYNYKGMSLYQDAAYIMPLKFDMKLNGIFLEGEDIKTQFTENTIFIVEGGDVLKPIQGFKVIGMYDDLIFISFEDTLDPQTSSKVPDLFIGFSPSYHNSGLLRITSGAGVYGRQFSVNVDEHGNVLKEAILTS